MNMTRWNLMGLALLALLLNSGLAHAFTLPGNSIPGIQKNINPKLIRPHAALLRKGFQQKIQGCPKLVAKELHIVRVVPQPVRAGVHTYRFVLDGTVKNDGFAGLATAGLNVVRKQNGRVVKRVALKIFKQQARRNQSFDVNRDLRVSIQSDAISRADASRSTFELSVLNLRNDRGSCANSRASVKTVTSTQVTRALPAQLRGGIARNIGTRVSGLNKPVTGPGGKSLLPPGANTGPRHLLGGDRPTPRRTAGVDRLDSVTPVSIASGGTLTVHGQFNTRYIRDRRYRYHLSLYPRRGGSGISLRITRSSATALIATVPRSVAPGSYSLRVDMQPPGGGLLALQQSNAIPITITSNVVARGGFAGVLGAARKPRIQIPLTGSGGTSLLPNVPQLKLTIDHLTRLDNSERIPVVNGRSTVTVPLHTSVMAYLRLQNTGTESENVSVTVTARGYRPSRAISVPPGGAGQLVLLRFVIDETNGEILDAAKGPIFIAQFKLVTPDGTVHDFSDGNNRDNKVSALILVASPPVVRIQNITVGSLQIHVGNPSRTDGDLERPYDGQTLHASVTIENVGTQPSEAAAMIVKLESTQDATRPRATRPRGSDGDTVQYLGSRGNGAPSGSQTISIELPSIAGNSRINKEITFNHVLFDLWQYNLNSSYRILGIKRHSNLHLPLAAGKFSCARPAWSVDFGSAFKITANIAHSGTGSLDSASQRVATGRFGQTNYGECSAMQQQDR